MTLDSSVSVIVSDENKISNNCVSNFAAFNNNLSLYYY